MRQVSLLSKPAMVILTLFIMMIARIPMALGQPATQQAVTSNDIACSSYAQGPPVPYSVEQVAGREYTITLENHRAMLLMPERTLLTGSIAWVWFSPMVRGEPNLHHAFIIQHVLGAGMAFASIDVGESYGSVEGTRLYDAFHNLLERCFHLSARAVLLPQSRGGLMLFNWAALHPDEVERIAGIYPVCSLRSYPGLKVAAPAYGMSEDELTAQLKQHNPLDLLPGLVKANVPVLLIHGADDKLVPLQNNSAEFVSRYQKLGGSATLLVIQGKGHEEADEFFKSPRFVSFLTTGK
jgi:pimeloyl-ACP methyl ester carboxylesterase